MFISEKKLVFHSSAIEVDNQAILFSGLSGSGKSSLSISFHDCNFITEDVSCIDFSDERPAVIPGLPLVKLSNAIANRFIKDAEKIPLDFDRLGRSYYHVKNHINENIPISKLYFLEWGNTFKISEIEPKRNLDPSISFHILISAYRKLQNFIKDNDAKPFNFSSKRESIFIMQR